MRPRRANRDEGRVANETAEREASEYAQAVFNQHKYGPRATARIPWSTSAIATADEQANALATMTPVIEWRTAQPAPRPTPIIEFPEPVEVMPTVDEAPAVEALAAVEPVADEIVVETLSVEAPRTIDVVTLVEVSPPVAVSTIVAEPVADEIVVETPEPEPSNLVELHPVPTSYQAPVPSGAATEPRTSDRTLLSVALGVGGVAAATIFSRRRRRT